MRSGARKLTEAVVLEKAVQAGDDGYGNVTVIWTPQIERRAEYIHLRGGEEVMEARLQGRHIQTIRVRMDEETELITTDWRVKDSGTGEIFNIRDVTKNTDRRWVDLLCESGVAT
jgi:SPP1 family predicted phage head-tail adaptor